MQLVQPKQKEKLIHNFPSLARYPAMPWKAGPKHMQLLLGRIDAIALNIVPFSSFCQILLVSTMSNGVEYILSHLGLAVFRHSLLSTPSLLTFVARKKR